MIFDWHNKGIDFETLYQEAQIVGDKVQAGWTHETIVRLLRNHGVLAYRQEFLGHTINFETKKGEVAEHAAQFVEKGIEKIKKSIDAGKPVFVSVKADFSENKEDHVVLVIGYDETNFIFHDPILNLEKTPLIYPIETFKSFWKNFAIFVE